MANSRRFVQASNNARELVEDAPYLLDGQDAARGRRDECFESDGRAEVLFDQVKVAGRSDRFEDLREEGKEGQREKGEWKEDGNAP
jgi:hypothetical protein